MRLKYAFLLLTFCVIILSCTDKKPVSQAQESSVQQEDSVPVKKVDSVKVAKTQPLTYKILVPFNYRLCNPDTIINRNWVELYKDGKDYYVGKARYGIEMREDMCSSTIPTYLAEKRNTILFVNQLPIKKGKVKIADIAFSDSTYLEPGSVRNFTFAGKHYKLEAKAQGESQLKNYTLLLNGERIVREARVDAASFALLFAGDLDGDGKLDLVLSLPTDYEELRVALFLSSCAPPGLQMGKVAEIEDDFSC